jgi:hypothetical protein
VAAAADQIPGRVGDTRMPLQDPSHDSLTPQPETYTVKPPVSEAKILANRTNALRSTGAKTQRGKRTVSPMLQSLNTWAEMLPRAEALCEEVARINAAAENSPTLTGTVI